MLFPEVVVKESNHQKYFNEKIIKPLFQHGFLKID